MKIYLSLFVLTLLISGLSFGQVSAQDAKITITKTQIIEASADEVWERLRKIDKLEEIIPDFLASSWIVDNAQPGVGVKRSCAAPGTPKGQASYTEQVVEYDDEKRYYAYAVIEGIPAKNMLNSFKVIDLGYKKCLVIWHSIGGEFIENPNMTKEQFLEFLNAASDAMMAGLYKLHNGQ